MLKVQGGQGYVASQAPEAVLSRHWEFGQAAGSADLAQKGRRETIEKGQSNFSPRCIPDAMPLPKRSTTNRHKILPRRPRGHGPENPSNQLKDWKKQGYGDLCAGR